MKNAKQNEFPSVTNGVTIKPLSNSDNPYKRVKLVLPSTQTKNIKILAEKNEEVYTIHNKETNKVEKLYSNSLKKEFQRELLMNLIIKHSIQRDDLFLTYCGFDAENLCLLFDFIELKTINYYIQKMVLPEQTKIKLWNSLIEAVKILHDNDIIHGDIHPNNIMVDPNTWKCKVLDFGNSGYKTDPNQVGTWIYQPPSNPDFLCKQLDIWALGMMYAYIFHFDKFQNISNLTEGDHHKKFNYEIFSGENVPDFIRSCVKSDPEQRPQDASFLYII